METILQDEEGVWRSGRDECKNVPEKIQTTVENNVKARASALDDALNNHLRRIED